MRRDGVGAILVAAGEGLRLDPDAATPKALVPLAGVPLVVHAARRLVASGVAALVVVHHPEHGPATAEALRASGVPGHDVDAPVLPLSLVPGGATRADSVRAGLAALPHGLDVVAIHDAARPLVPTAVVAAAIDALVDDVVASAPALPLADTLKHVAADGTVSTRARDGLVGVQTPQVLRRDVLEAALAAAAEASAADTDELVPVERLLAEGRLVGRILLVEGSALAHKVTYRRDLELLEALVRSHPDATVSSGPGARGADASASGAGSGTGEAG